VKQIPILPWDVSILEPEDGDVDQCRYRFRSEVASADVELEHDLRHQPAGIASLATSLGIKHPGVLDFSLIKLARPGTCAGVYTKNRCTSPAVKHDRVVTSRGRAQVLAVISKNANVFTPTADADIETLARDVAAELQVSAEDVLVSCTGVIGVALPMEKVRNGVKGLSSQLKQGNLDSCATGILTTDRGPKVCSAKFGDVKVAAIGKGAGMIEPNMATMLVYFFTNLAVDPITLQAILNRVVARTFNSISVDSDTSTSDTVLVMSTDEVPVTPAHLKDFENALACMAAKLGRDIVYQAEGSTKLIEVSVRGAASYADAKRMAKRVVNSPLVKTAINGADPNWGRVVMAIGKPDESDSGNEIEPSTVTIQLLGQTVFANGHETGLDLQQLSAAMRDRKTVRIEVEVGTAQTEATVWGCDLSNEYVKINAEYTT
jgi:glutamate N-acetyltransferase/amino-acid N-acetyltransferase